MQAIFKDPITDNFHKKSLSGIPIVTGTSGEYKVHTTLDPQELNKCAFRRVFGDGVLFISENFDSIRERARQ